MATFWFYPGAFSKPPDAMSFEDIDEEWREALEKPDVVPKEEKVNLPAICALEYKPGTTSKTLDQSSIVGAHGMVLDVDCWRPDRPPFTLDELKDRLDGFRFLGWTTFNSLADALRWRIIIPFATPMPVTKFKPLWRIVNVVLDGTMNEASTSDPGRLGFFKGVASEAGRQAYQWHIQPGDPLDWTAYDLVDEEMSTLQQALSPSDLSRSPDWSSRDQALEKAKRYFRKVGGDVEEGGRHECLLTASCRLWWDWAAEDDDFVRDVLSQINDNFPSPKDPQSVEDEVTAGYQRVLGSNRMEQPVLYGAQREPVQRATLSGLSEHAKALRTRNRDQSRLVGRALARIAAGEAYGEPVEARALAMLCVEEAAGLYDRESPDRLMELFRPALQAQRMRSAVHPLPTDQEVLAKIRWTQQVRRKQHDEREKNKRDDISQRISKAFKGQRDTPYSTQEYKEWEQYKGFDDRQWILQYGRSFYFWIGGEYRGPFDKDTADNHAETFLSPAHERLKLTFLDKTGAIKHRPINDLVRDYGTAIESVQHSLYETGSIHRNSMLIKACCPLRQLAPTHSPLVEEWLKLLGGHKYEQLCQWLSAVTYLDRPLLMLALMMPPNVGKNLLACGLSRLWVLDSGPTKLEDVTIKPERMETCPLLFADDKLPVMWRRDFLGTLKQFVADGARDVNRKWMSDYRLVGFPRLIIAGNNVHSMMPSGEVLSSWDLKAMTDRVLLIKAATADGEDHPAKKYLESLSRLTVDSIVDDDILAKHVLWLRDNVTISGQHRFFVNDTGTEFENTMAVTHDARSLAYEWVSNFVLSKRFGVHASVVAKEGQLYANSTLMVENWRLHDATNKGTRAREVTMSLRAMSLPGRYRICVDENNKKLQDVAYRALDMDKFSFWAEHNGVGIEEMAEAITELQAARPVRIIAHRNEE